MNPADDVLNNWQKVAMRIQAQATDAALTEMAVQAMMYASIMTPVDTSNLINSQFHELEFTPAGMSSVIGYSARYAAAVHEAPETLKGQPRVVGGGNYWDGVGGSGAGEREFLKKGRDEMIKNDYQRIIKENYKL